MTNHLLYVDQQLCRQTWLLTESRRQQRLVLLVSQGLVVNAVNSCVLTMRGDLPLLIVRVKTNLAVTTAVSRRPASVSECTKLSQTSCLGTTNCSIVWVSLHGYKLFTVYSWQFACKDLWMDWGHVAPMLWGRFRGHIYLGQIATRLSTVITAASKGSETVSSSFIMRMFEREGRVDLSEHRQLVNCVPTLNLMIDCPHQI